jgi:hypothetical protein
LHEPPEIFRLYEEHECGQDGYPFAWHQPTQAPPELQTGLPQDGPILFDPVKVIVRSNADNRCIRCKHPYTKGDGEWSPCDSECLHMGLCRFREIFRPGEDRPWHVHDLSMQGMTASEARLDEGPDGRMMQRYEVEAHWRILTVHHLLVGQEHKRNLKWWNLVSLCQRCHLVIQRKVDLTRAWFSPHSVWFQPYAAGWYAWRYLAEDLSRSEAMERLEELLALERRQDPLWS